MRATVPRRYDNSGGLGAAPALLRPAPGGSTPAALPPRRSAAAALCRAVLCRAGALPCRRSAVPALCRCCALPCRRSAVPALCRCCALPCCDLPCRALPCWRSAAAALCGAGAVPCWRSAVPKPCRPRGLPLGHPSIQPPCRLGGGQCTAPGVRARHPVSKSPCPPYRRCLSRRPAVWRGHPTCGASPRWGQLTSRCCPWPSAFSPTLWSSAHIVAWFAVTTGLPSSRSSGAITS